MPRTQNVRLFTIVLVFSAAQAMAAGSLGAQRTAQRPGGATPQPVRPPENQPSLGQARRVQPALIDPPRVQPPLIQPPLIGTLGKEAARALAGRSHEREPSRGTSAGVTRGMHSGRALSVGSGYGIPLLVRDAPVYNRGGSTLGVQTVSPEVVSSPAFYPTMEPPVWRLVAEERPVQGWRIVEVQDVVCYPSGTCATVTTRVVARWAPALRGYAFRDRVGRVWRVE